MRTKTKRKPQMCSLALHESGHVIAAAAYGVPLDPEEVIDMHYGEDSEDGSGCVYYDAKFYDLLTVEQKTVLALAGLAADRYFDKNWGGVYLTVKIKDRHYKLHIPKEMEGRLSKDGTGDLNTVRQLMPAELCAKWGKEEEWCNRHLKTAWDLLHQHEAAFLELVEALSPSHRSYFGSQLQLDYSDYAGYWEFEPRALAHILHKVSKRCSKAA